MFSSGFLSYGGHDINNKDQILMSAEVLFIFSRLNFQIHLFSSSNIC